MGVETALALPPRVEEAPAGALEEALRREPAESAFECNVCLELASDPVITLCGHLYCWPCLYRWLALNASFKTCPVCKAGVDEDKVVPLYGRGTTHSDPRKLPLEGLLVPLRPAAQRPLPSLRVAGHGFVPTFFGLHGTHVTLSEPLSPEQQQQAFLSRLLLMLGSFVIMCLLLF